MPPKAALASLCGSVNDVVQFQIMRLFLTALMALTLAQDPTKTLPKSYKVEFENAAVRIVRVHYDAKAKLPEHEHPGGVTVYLYFNASSGVRFEHDDGIPITRPAVQPGAIRIGAGPGEHHTVTNLADTPTDFIRILVKNTDVVIKNRPMTRIPPSQMEYENPMMHISRIDVQPGTKTRIEAGTYPKLRIAWVPGTTEWKLAAKDGYRFLEKGTTEEFEVTGKLPMQLVTIELRPIPKQR